MVWSHCDNDQDNMVHENKQMDEFHPCSTAIKVTLGSEYLSKYKMLFKTECFWQ